MKERPAVVGVRELRAHLSSYVRRVAGGETVTIGDRRRRPLARLVPIQPSEDDEVLERLARDGALRRGVGRPGTSRRLRLRGTGRSAAAVVREQRG
jgi:prevent-host-death family protein